MRYFIIGFIVALFLSLVGCAELSQKQINALLATEHLRLEERVTALEKAVPVQTPVAVKK